MAMYKVARQNRGTEEDSPYDDVVVKVYRCAKVVRGGRRFSFAALVVLGDRHGRVGIGYGKANEVPLAVEKGRKHARRALQPIQLDGPTIPHPVLGHFGSSRVYLLPASAGTGVIAGASVRAVLELAGVHDCLTKAHGSTSPKNLVKATFQALESLRDRKKVESLRGVSLAG
jgi:small subunit ribosomal protein S5